MTAMLRMQSAAVAQSVSIISERTISGPMILPTDEQHTVSLLDAVSSTAIYVQRRAESSGRQFAAHLETIERSAEEMVTRCLSRKK